MSSISSSQEVPRHIDIGNQSVNKPSAEIDSHNLEIPSLDKVSGEQKSEKTMKEKALTVLAYTLGVVGAAGVVTGGVSLLAGPILIAVGAAVSPFMVGFAVIAAGVYSLLFGVAALGLGALAVAGAIAIEKHLNQAS